MIKIRSMIPNDTSPPSTSSLEVQHARFIAEAPAKQRWGKHGITETGTGMGNGNGEDEMEGITATRGKILPTSSHLFKLVLPLPDIKNGAVDTPSSSSSGHDPESHPSTPPTIFLLHPSQPLSHLSRLIASSISLPTQKTKKTELVISITVPTFADRTKYLRRRLAYLTSRLASMEELKLECDREAHRGARKMALGGFGMLVVYWAGVARLTFWDYGWDIMEPITYLSGLSTVILGYLWFLYQGREVSYTSVLARSISARREALYKAKGFDIERWMEMVSERKEVRGVIERIASDYEEEGEGGEGGKDEETGEGLGKKESEDVDVDLKGGKDKEVVIGDTKL
ncbi:hypothetical protein BJ165DRAFT_1415525 [Panaeolus papilionaceus]|nr:hypothetical protein BJ165DRAFT_1415525 [Panaeolus papilionaceus]